MSDCSQHLGAFLYFESVVTEINQFFVFLRNGGSEYDERTFLVLTGFRNQVDVFFVMYLCAFGDQGFSQWSRGTVVACHYFAFEKEVTYKCTHADAAGTYEID